MANTAIEYSVWRAPKNPNFTNIPYEDRWLFSEPFYTFPLGTATSTIKRTFATFRINETKPIGSTSIPATVRLRKRVIHYGEYLNVPDNDPDFIKAPSKISITL